MVIQSNKLTNHQHGLEKPHVSNVQQVGQQAKGVTGRGKQAQGASKFVPSGLPWLNLEHTCF